MVRLAGYDYESFADADGVSCVLFVSGCKHNCFRCHSPQTHNFDYGLEITDDIIDKINSEIDRRPYLNALVLSGGDPMYSARDLLGIVPKLHIPNGNLWCYSGFTLDEIKSNQDMRSLLNLCNYLVDGTFDYTKRDVTLKFRGSSNQNIWRREGIVWKNITDEVEQGGIVE